MAGCKKDPEAPAPVDPTTEQAIPALETSEIPAEIPTISAETEIVEPENPVTETVAEPPAPAQIQPEPEPEPEILENRFEVEQFIFKFHRETQDEICGDADYFTYNGSLMLVGKIQSEIPVDMEADDFELELMTPFESYILPAWRERETLEDDEEIEQVFTRKGTEMIFFVKGYRVEDDDVVYRDDEDETGSLKNFGPLIDAVFDWKNQKFVLSVTHAELSAEDIKTGELLDLSLLMSDFNFEDEGFDQTSEFRYTGESIDSEHYNFNGECP